MPLVSVVMPVYNGEKFVAEARESILAQTFADFEFLIVDDGSQDNSAEIIRAYQERDDRIRFFQHERNLGVASARNSGIALASGEYIAAMDCDDISLPERLQKQVDYMQTHPEIGLVGNSVLIVDRDMKTLSVRDLPLHHSLIVLNLFFRGASLIHGSVMTRRDVMTSVGAYNSASRAVDDTDLYVRLGERTRFANLPERLFLYRRHEQNNTLIQRQRNFNTGQVIRARWLNRLCDDASAATADRLERLRSGMKFSWVERRLLRRDLERLIEAMIAAEYLRTEDRSVLDPEIARRLESTTPRLWQMYCHWRRNHFGR